MTATNQAFVEFLYPPEHAYDLAAPHYDAWKWQSFWRRVERPMVVSTVREWAAVAKKPRLADIGCGTGSYLADLEAYCSSVVGLDISGAMLARARARLADTELLQGDVRDLPFEDEKFEVVLSTRMLSHVKEIDVAISEIVRISSVGGMIILSDIDPQHHYHATRLPTGTGHIGAETFKHSRATIMALLIGLGANHVQSALMFLDGDAVPVADLASDAPHSAVGWISTWTRDG